VGMEGLPSELPGSERTTGLKFSQDGNWVLALGDGSRVARLTDDLAFEEVRSFPSARSGDISADGSLVVLANSSIISGEITMFERSTRNAKWSLWANSNNVQVVRFSPDGKKVAAAGGGSYDQPARPVDSDITVYDSASGELIARLRGHEREVSGLVFGADSEHLISSSHDGTIRVWQVSEKKLLRTLIHDRRGASHLQLASNGTALFYVQGDGNLMSLDLTGAFDAGPRLEVRAENGVALRWTAGSGTVLERSAVLGAGANWVEETNVISKGEGNFEFAVPAGGEAGFYRLRQ
jgi:WD40 repeat protein